jgi:hypothetical protein
MAGQASKYPVSHAARTVLDPEISPSKIRRRSPAAWLMNSKKDSSSPEPQPIVVGATFTLNNDDWSRITSI